MNIYVSHSSSFDYKKELYEPLRSLQTEHSFTFPHENSSKPFHAKEFFSSKKCDLVLAEVSYPSTGQGIELGWANFCNIPIVCIHKKGAKVSKSVPCVAAGISEYETIDKELIEEVFKGL